MPFDEQQYQWEEIPEEGVEPPRHLPTWVKWVGISIISLLLVVGLVFLVRGMLNRFAQDEKMEEVEVQVSRAEAECLSAQDQEKCISRIAFRLASDHGDSDYCIDIADAVERDECYTVAAVVSLNADGCTDVESAELRANCEDAILAQTIDVNDGIEACEGFSQEVDRVSCKSVYEFTGMLAEDCLSRGISQQLCDDGAIMLQAIANENPDYCDQILNEEQVMTCIELVTVIDRDQDGLTEEEELLYGTDDRNPDTDGDGFGDRQEIESGYDPLA